MKKHIIFAAIAAAGISANVFGSESSWSNLAGESAYQPQVGVNIGGFWGEKYKTLVTKWIPHCIRQMEHGGEGEELMNLVAAGQKLRGEKPCRKFQGCKWSDAYPYNIIEAASLALELDPSDDAELKAGQDFLRKKIEEWIPVILAAQEESGYIDSYTCLHNMPHFRKAADHEFYVMGYFIEMGIAHHRATGDRRLIDAAIKCADHLDSIFGPSPKRTWMNGHPGLEYALCRLADATGDEKYARLAQYFIRNQHTCRENHSAYNQAERPAADMSEAKGHAVRANYFYAAIAAVANRLGDKPLGEAAKRLFDSIVDRKMYLTGGIGADYAKEAYGEDYDLPQDAYAESCAGCGLEFFAREARSLVGSDKAEAVRERVIYNNILGAISRNGEKFYYQNPLSSNRPRSSWHGCPCCVGNIPRTLLALKDSIFSVKGEALYINQYMDIENAKVTIGGKEYLVSLNTDYPAEGKVSLGASFPADIKVFARFPNRAESALYKAEPEVEHGYKRIPQSPWCGMSSWELPLLEQKVTADERVASCRGRVAYQRGPIVYSWENGEKLPNYDRLNHGGYSEVWRSVDAQAAPKPLLCGFHPDPSVCLGHDGAYYLTTSTFMWRPGLPIYRSEDFRSWSLVGNAISNFNDVALEEDAKLNDDDGVWAPTIRYNDGIYYLVFTFHGKKSRNYLTMAKSPAGPWSTPVHIKEADGGIDPSIFFDDDGKCYWTANTAAKPQEWKSQTAIYVQEIDLSAGKLVGERKVISNGAMPQAKYAEGPHLYKIQGEYVLIQAEGGTDFNHAATAMKSKSVWGPYTPTRNNPVLTRRDRGKNSPLQATGHADLVKMKDAGKEYYWAVFLGKRPVGEDRRDILGRETFACPALWRDGDLIFQDERLVAGEIVTPEEECEAALPGTKIRRVRDLAFDETFRANEGEAMILYRSAESNIILEGPGFLRMVSDDGICVKCYRDNEFVKEIPNAALFGEHTRFNGLGIGKISIRGK
ncbi:MAG: glycoside hydrolase family 127 protein [Kiritimatiellae bacterium]|nr:glycoside hydrolase family 127 protein [Kiritimatiellia bacterium]